MNSPNEGTEGVAAKGMTTCTPKSVDAHNTADSDFANDDVFADVPVDGVAALGDDNAIDNGKDSTICDDGDDGDNGNGNGDEDVDHDDDNVGVQPLSAVRQYPELKDKD